MATPATRPPLRADEQLRTLGISPLDLVRLAQWRARRSAPPGLRVDAVGEWLVKALGAALRADPCRKPLSYLRIAGRWAVKTFVAAELSRPRTLSLDAPPASRSGGQPLRTSVPAEGPRPDEALEKADHLAAVQAALHEALDALDPRSRRAVVAIYYEGKSQTAVAREMRVSRQYVGQLLKGAFRHLGRYLRVHFPNIFAPNLREGTATANSFAPTTAGGSATLSSIACISGPAAVCWARITAPRRKPPGGRQPPGGYGTT